MLLLLAGVVDGKLFSSAFPLSSVDSNKLFHSNFLIPHKLRFFSFFHSFFLDWSEIQINKHNTARQSKTLNDICLVFRRLTLLLKCSNNIIKLVQRSKVIYMFDVLCSNDFYAQIQILQSCDIGSMSRTWGVDIKCPLSPWPKPETPSNNSFRNSAQVS